MIMSVSTLIIFSGAATPSSLTNLSMTDLDPAAVMAGRGTRVKGSRRRDCRRDVSFVRVSSPFDRLHVGVRQAEMVADLVHQHVRDDRAQRVVVLGPVVEDRTAIEP